MDADTRELIRSLFARAIALAEDCCEAAVTGQHPRIEFEEAAALAQQLRASATALQTLASTIDVLVTDQA